ncbi:hypothetical protein T484DRAFT_1771864 [Baffinella frigidus]|nr:hypothetical protein T484DRAFT_1771864 [Cryptophyta sp. CCMP2293]
MIPSMAVLQAGNWLSEKAARVEEGASDNEDTAAPARKKRQQCAVACIPCSKAKAACDDVRPCSRCIRQNNVSCCVDKAQSWYSAGENGQIPAGGKRPPGVPAAARDVPLSPAKTAEPASKKRRQLSKGRACLACFRSKTGCDDSRPCARCVRVNGGNCVDKYSRAAPARRVLGAGVLDLLMAQDGAPPPSKDGAPPPTKDTANVASHLSPWLNTAAVNDTTGVASHLSPWLHTADATGDASHASAR